MSPLLWLALTWIAGTLLILGSLMTLGSLLLWLVPASPIKGKKTDDRASASTPQPWQGRLKLLVFSIAIALTGLGLLVAFPFPG